MSTSDLPVDVGVLRDEIQSCQRRRGRLQFGAMGSTIRATKPPTQ